MLQPNENTLRAIVNLAAGQPELWTMFMEWITQSFMHQLGVGIQIKDETDSKWMVGRNQCLSDLIGYVAGASNQLEKIKQAAENSGSTAAAILD